MITALKEIFQKYKTSPNLIAQLKKAYIYELIFRKGIAYNENIRIFAKLYSHDALWQIDFVTKNGNLKIKQLDKDTYHFQSFYNEVLEVEKVVNLRKTKELTDLKNALIEKSFLQYINSTDSPGKNFAELIVIAIQNYRKSFNDHVRINQFLWKDTGFKCAYELYNYLK